MKKRIKRIISMFSIAVAMLSMLSVNVMATENTDDEMNINEYVPKNTYVMDYTGEYTGNRYQYYSPYMFSKVLAGTDAESGKENVTLVYTLYNTVTNIAYPAFCVDNRYDAALNAKYQRMNLEDATYFDDDAAAKVRAILLSSYPNVTLESIQTATEQPELTVAEIMSATQIALYRVVHGDAFVMKDYYSRYYTCSNEAVAAIKYHGECTPDYNKEEKKAVRSRIENTCTYFLNLPGASAQNQLVTTASFTDYSQAPVVTGNENGTYNVAITAKATVVMQENDTMMLSAVMGDGTYLAQAELQNGENEVTLTIENVPAELAYTEVMLAIDGMQTAIPDVFLFMAQGGETASQSFAAIDNSQLPVHAEVTLVPPMEIILKKTADIKTKGADRQDVETTAPLEGIAFDVYRLGDVDAAQNYGEVDWTTANIGEYVNGENYVTTLITDASGSSTCNLTAAGQMPGTFLVVEKSHPAITSPEPPEMVTLPYATDSGNVYRKELSFKNTIKNEIYETPQVRKDVTWIENNLDSFDLRELHTWIIRGDIPVDIAVGKEYVITDTLDYRLTYAGDAGVVVKVGLRNGGTGTETVTLTRDVDYTLVSTSGETTVGDAGIVEPISSFEIRLTDAGKRVVAGAVENGVFSDYEVRVYFNAYIDEDASAGEMIPNQAILEYINYVNYYSYAYSDTPMVYTCGIMVYKHDAADENVPLSDAKFKLARLATQAEIDAGLSDPMVINGETVNVVYVSFYTKSEMTQEEFWAEKSLSVTSDAAGFATLYGIADGAYYLIETKAPAGYNLLSEPIPVNVNSQTPYLVKYVANSSNLEFPPTGGIGTTIFMVGGAILIGAAIVILILNRKKEDAEEDEEE